MLTKEVLVNNNCVLHIIDWVGMSGGAEIIAIETAANISGKNLVAYFWAEEGFDKKNFPNVDFIHITHGPSIPNLLRIIKKIRRIIIDHQVGLVHAHLYWSILFSRLAVPGRILFFTTIHNIQSKSSLRYKWLQVIEKLVYREQETTFCVSKAVMKDYKKIVPKANTQVLYNFISDDFFLIKRVPLLKSSRSYKFIAVGNIKDQKNYPYLIKIFERLKELRDDRFQVDIYGVGDSLPKIQEEMTHKNLPVNFKGIHLDIKNIIGNYDAFISVSKYEGYCLALGEAMAGQIPVILADTEIFREISGGNALLMDLNDVEAGVKTLNEFASDIPGAIERARKGLKFISGIATKSTYLKEIMAYYNGEKSILLDGTKKVNVHDQ